MKRITLLCLAACFFGSSLLHAGSTGEEWRNRNYIGQGEESIARMFGNPDRVVLPKQVYVRMKKGEMPQVLIYEYIGSAKNPFFRDVPIIPEGAYGDATGFIGFDQGKVSHYGYRVKLTGNCADVQGRILKALEHSLGKSTDVPTATNTVRLFSFGNGYELGFACRASSNVTEVTLSRK